MAQFEILPPMQYTVVTVLATLMMPFGSATHSLNTLAIYFGVPTYKSISNFYNLGTSIK